MKSLNAKRIAAVAASLLMGLAVAGQGVTFGNIPIINNAGQPVVQIVVGSSAMPSDGVVAANIAAAIGSLAHTTQNITATVSGRSGVSCVVTTPTCTLSNQQVWLGEKGLTVAAGSYSFTALIGSVLNGGALNSGNLQYTKNLLGGTGTGSYTYPDGSTAPFAISTSPTSPSAYEGIGPINIQSSVIAGTNGGGLQFTRLTNNSQDNIMRLSNSQVPGLLSSAGPYQETENLWVGGFPVFDQASNVSNFGLLDTQLAYQISFGKPIQNRTNGASTNAGFSLLGENWTVYNLIPPVSVHGVTSNSFVIGGNVTLAQASTPLTTVYVGHNITSGPFTVVLNDLSYPNSNGLANAALSVYKNGVLTNVTAVGPAGSIQQTINASGTKLFISVPQTFPGLYAYQKWAKIQLFSNTFNVSSGKDFQESTNGHSWVALLRWTTNQTTANSETSANSALQGIILYRNMSQATMLSPGQSLSIIGNPAVWKLNFVGDTLGTPGSGNTNYDQISVSTSSGSQVSYQNYGGADSQTANAVSFASNGLPVPGNSLGTYFDVNSSMIKEAANYFTVSSSLPNAFIVSPESGGIAPTSNLQTVHYNLDTYKFVPGNAVDSKGTLNLTSSGFPNSGLVAVLQNNGVNGNYVTQTNPLTVQLYGFSRAGQSSTTSPSFTFNGFNTQTLVGTTMANLSDITLSYALPNPGVNVLVYESSNVLNPLANNAMLLGALYYNGAAALYSVPSVGFMQLGNSASVSYTGENNNVNFALATNLPSNTAVRGLYGTYTMPEITVSTSSTPGANTVIDLTNSSSTPSSPLYWLNSSTTGNNAVGYQSSQVGSSLVKAQSGFRTERGSEIASISTTSLTYDMAKSIDGLQFVVGPSGSNSSSTTRLYGPYGVGQATNIPNVTVSKVNATCTFSTTSCSVSGLNNLTAVPSVSSAVVANPLNTATTPLAVLDSNANNASTLIVVGSKYVNSVAAQIFAQNPSFDQSFGPTGSSAVTVQAFGQNRILVAGYTASQTVQAGNQFIQALLASAST